MERENSKTGYTLRFDCSLFIETVLLIFFLLNSYEDVNAQIGINTSNPDLMSALDIRGDGKRGLLIPFANQANREAMKSQPIKKGMLVCDSIDFSLYIYTGIEWKNLSPFTFTKDSSSNSNLYIDETTLNGKNVGIGTNDPQAKLHVVGTTRFDTDFLVNGNQTINGLHIVNGDYLVKGDQRIEGDLSVIGNETVAKDKTVLGSSFIKQGSIIGGNLTINNNITIGANANVDSSITILGNIIGNGQKIMSVNADSVDNRSGKYFLPKDSANRFFQILDSTKLDKEAFTPNNLLSFWVNPGYYMDPLSHAYYDSCSAYSGELRYYKVKNVVFVTGYLDIRSNIKRNYCPVFQFNSAPPSNSLQYFDAMIQSGNDPSDLDYVIKNSAANHILFWIKDDLIGCIGDFLPFTLYRVYLNFFYWTN